MSNREIRRLAASGSSAALPRGHDGVRLIVRVDKKACALLSARHGALLPEVH